ncbi:MAG: hypothetical protein JWM74_1469 [Myxococcaceae bacterium]|nr:hypothetical protein [Myxococcaceae bacterium]
MKALASFVFWAAIVAYSIVGLTGILLGPYELGLSGVDLSVLPSVERGTLLGQIRFFKALELAVGVAFYLQRARLHTDAGFQRFVALVLWITPLARLVSMASDGLPTVPFRALAVFELTGAVTFTAYALREWLAGITTPTTGVARPE